jgi:chloride channel 3/4/5
VLLLLYDRNEGHAPASAHVLITVFAFVPALQTILGGFVIHVFAGPMTLVIKAVGLVMSVASGLNCGKEGPMVHVACCVASLFGRWFPKYSQNQCMCISILLFGGGSVLVLCFLFCCR